MKDARKKLLVIYTFVDSGQIDRQKRLDDAYDVIFDEIEAEEIGRINHQNEYEHPTVIK